MNMKKVVSYTRVSTKQQVDGYSLPAQLQLIKEHCTNHNKHITASFTDEGLSAKDTNRPGLQSMLNYIRFNDIQEVVILRFSRLSRSVSDLLAIVNQLNLAGVKIVSIHDPIDYSSPYGLCMLQMVASMNELERNANAQNLSLGKRERAKQGYYCGSPIYGYSLVKKADMKKAQLSINEQEAKVVQLVFRLYNEFQYGYKKIANQLNNMAIPTKHKKKWSINTIRSMLKNEVYCGMISYSDGNTRKMVPGNHQAIINTELINRKKGRVRKNQKDYVPLFPKVIKCPKCKSTMSLGKVTNNQQQYHYYTCSTYMNKGKHACSAKGMNAKYVDTMIVNFLTKVITEKFKDVANTKSSISNRAVLQAKRKMQLQKEKLINDFEACEISHEEFVEKLQLIEINTIKSSTEEQVTKLQQNLQLFVESDTSQKRAVISQWVQRINMNTDYQVATIEVEHVGTVRYIEEANHATKKNSDLCTSINRRTG